MNKILVSECLIGKPVRYDGQSKPIEHPLISQWRRENRLVAICPEMSGGLPTPRPPAEIQAMGKVITMTGVDVTLAFELGAQNALAMCIKHDIKFALLKESSPSCGSRFVYDGSFSGKKIKGMGMTATLLSQNGIRVFSEDALEELSDAISVNES